MEWRQITLKVIANRTTFYDGQHVQTNDKMKAKKTIYRSKNSNSKQTIYSFITLNHVLSFK